MSIETIYGAWKLYKYITAAHSTYEKALAVYGTACTVAATTGAVVAYVIPTNKGKEPTQIYVENKDGWDVVDIL